MHTSVEKRALRIPPGYGTLAHASRFIIFRHCRASCRCSRGISIHSPIVPAASAGTKVLYNRLQLHHWFLIRKSSKEHC
jgi:hypothetical protein